MTIQSTPSPQELVAEEAAKRFCPGDKMLSTPHYIRTIYIVGHMDGQRLGETNKEAEILKMLRTSPGCLPGMEGQKVMTAGEWADWIEKALKETKT
jgi:hypothetical protein